MASRLEKRLMFWSPPSKQRKNWTASTEEWILQTSKRRKLGNESSTTNARDHSGGLLAGHGRIKRGKKSKENQAKGDAGRILELVPGKTWVNKKGKGEQAKSGERGCRQDFGIGP